MVAAFEHLAGWFIKRLNDRGFGELRDQLAADFPEEKPPGEPSTGIVEGTGTGTLANAGGCGGGSSGVHLYACDDEYSTRWNAPDVSPIRTVNGNVLTNDHDTDWTHTLSSYWSSYPQHGDLVLNPDGTMQYTSDDGYIGADMFFYYVLDGYGYNDVAAVTIYVYEPDIDVDSNNDGTIDDDNSAGGTDDWIELEPLLPGKVLGFNDDDDDGNGTPDFQDNGPSAAENDLVEMNLDIPFENGFLQGYTVNLEFDTTSLAIWDSPTKDNRITFSSTQPLDPVPNDNWWLLGTETVPATVWIEGIAPSAPPSLRFVLQPTGPPAVRDEAFVTVASVDLHADSDNDGDVDETAAEDNIEMAAPGSVLMQNVDDDNENGLQDWQEAPFLTIGVPPQPMDDDDLERVTLDFDAGGIVLPGFSVELVPSNNILLWETADKQPLRQDLTYIIGTHMLPTIFVEGVDPGQAQLMVVVRDAQGDLFDTDTILFTVLHLDAVAYRPQTELALYGQPFPKTFVPSAEEFNPGVGIRHNGDNDDGNGVDDKDETSVAGENDLIEVDLFNLPNPAVGIEYVVSRTNNNIQVWQTGEKEGEILKDDDSIVIDLTTTDQDVWVEWVGNNPALVADLTIAARAINTQNIVATDTIRFWPFQSVVIAFLGRGNTPPDPTDGAWVIALNLYQAGYDVHAYNEESVDAPNNPPKAEVRNAIENREVGQVAIFGYSQGGGATYVLADQLVNGPIPPQAPWFLSFTAYIDAIWQDGGLAETRLPPYPQGSTPYHVNYYQRNLPWRGAPTDQPSINVNVNDTTWGAVLDHDSVAASIDSNLIVQNRIMNGFAGPAGGGNVIHDGLRDRIVP